LAERGGFSGRKESTEIWEKLAGSVRQSRQTNVNEPFDLSYSDGSNNFNGIEARDGWFRGHEMTRRHAPHDAHALRDAYSEMQRRLAVG